MAFLNNGNNSALVVFSMKRQPPINFNLALHSHAMQHGLSVNNIGLHPHASGISVSINLSGAHIAKAKEFADTAVNKFGTYVHHATVQFGSNVKI